MENNIKKLESYQATQEEIHSVSLEETIERLLLEAICTLELEPIFKNSRGDDWEYDVEESEPYIGNDGKVLKGYLLYSFQEFHREGMDGNMELEKEIFLTDEGYLVVYTTTEYDYCHQCEQVHCRLHRVIARDQSLSFGETEAVLNELSIELDEEPLIFE